MEYNPLNTVNPTAQDITEKSSVWIASRIMPGKGNSKISFSFINQINNGAAFTCTGNDLYLMGLIGMSAAMSPIVLHNGNPATSASIAYKGVWVGTNDEPVIGVCSSFTGLAAPFNSFNMGYRYKKGWRPSYV